MTKKRRLLPVIDPDSGTTRTNYTEIAAREMADLDSDSDSDATSSSDPIVTSKVIEEKQAHMNNVWPKRLANVSL